MNSEGNNLSQKRAQRALGALLKMFGTVAKALGALLKMFGGVAKAVEIVKGAKFVALYACIAITALTMPGHEPEPARTHVAPAPVIVIVRLVTSGNQPTDMRAVVVQVQARE